MRVALEKPGARRVLARLFAGVTDTATTWQRNSQKVVRNRTDHEPAKSLKI
jgi:hypothetical protein